MTEAEKKAVAEAKELLAKHKEELEADDQKEEEPKTPAIKTSNDELNKLVNEKLKALKPDLTKYVSKEEHDKAITKLAIIKAEAQKKIFEENGGIVEDYDDFIKVAGSELEKSEDIDATMKELIEKKPKYFKINDNNTPEKIAKMTPAQREEEKRKRVIETKKGIYW